MLYVNGCISVIANSNWLCFEHGKVIFRLCDFPQNPISVKSTQPSSFTLLKHNTPLIGIKNNNNGVTKK